MCLNTGSDHNCGYFLKSAVRVRTSCEFGCRTVYFRARKMRREETKKTFYHWKRLAVATKLFVKGISYILKLLIYFMYSFVFSLFSGLYEKIRQTPDQTLNIVARGLKWLFDF